MADALKPRIRFVDGFWTVEDDRSSAVGVSSRSPVDAWQDYLADQSMGAAIEGAMWARVAVAREMAARRRWWKFW